LKLKKCEIEKETIISILKGHCLLNENKFEITRSFAIKNLNLENAFKSQLNNIEHRLKENTETFGNQKWKEDSNSNNIIERNFVYNQFESICNTFDHNELIKSNILIGFHAVPNENVAKSIFESGFASLEKLDSGYFGKGNIFNTRIRICKYLFYKNNNKY